MQVFTHLVAIPVIARDSDAAQGILDKSLAALTCSTGRPPVRLGVLATEIQAGVSAMAPQSRDALAAMLRQMTLTELAGVLVAWRGPAKPMVTVVANISGGATHRTCTDASVRVIYLNSDTEGCDPDALFRIDGDIYYVHDTVAERFASADSPEVQSGADYVASVVKQLATLEADPGPYLVGHWTAHFDGSRTGRHVRLAYSSGQRRIIALQEATEGGYVPAEPAVRHAVEKSLLDTHSMALSVPESYDLQLLSTLPDWALDPANG